MNYVLVGAQVLIALVFAVSAFTKLRGRRAFAAFRSSVAGMRLMPAGLTAPVAAVVAATEVAIPLLLLVPVTRAAGFAAALLLLIAFSAGIARVLAAGTTASCRCFGVSAAPFGRHHLVRNGVLAAVAATGLLAATRPALDAAPPEGLAVAVGAALVTGFVVVMLDDIVDLFR